MTYLETLMLRLAHGMANVPESIRAKHEHWLLAAQRTDGGFAGREGDSDPYYTSFALRALALLGSLDGPPARHAAAFLQGRLSGQAPMVDFVSILYGAALLETSAGLDVFERATDGWRQAVAGMFESFRRPDGGYAKTAEGQSSSTYHTFLVVLATQLLGLPTAEPERLAEFVRSRQRDDGGFVEVAQMRTSGTNPTAAAAALLGIMGAMDADTRDRVVDFLAGMQADEGGLTANTRIPLADLLSTFTGSLTLADAEALTEIDIPAARRYALSLQADEGGFCGGAWDDGTDVEYTFYGLAALALLGFRD